MLDKKQVINLLKSIDFDIKDYFVSAGGAMLFYDLRKETEDIDIAANAKLIEKLEKEGYVVKINKYGNRWIIYNEYIEIFEYEKKIK